MKISSEVIEEYTDYLSCTHDAIMREINSISSRISRELANDVYSFLRNLKNNSKNYLVLPEEDHINAAIIQTIRDGYFNSIESIESFIKRQNYVMDCFIEKDDNSDKKVLKIDLDYLLPQFRRNEQDLTQKDPVNVSYYQLVDQIIIHINSRNTHNENYIYFEDAIQEQVPNFVFHKIEKENESFMIMRNSHKQNLLRKTLQLEADLLEEQKKQEKVSIHIK